MSFSARLKEVLKEKGMTQTELAKVTNLSKSAISEWLSGKYEPKQDKIYLIAEKLSVSPSWLFGVSDIKEIKPTILEVYNQLEEPRQKYVYDVAEQQLEEQNNVLKFPDSKKIIRGRQTAAGSALYSDDDEAHMEVLSASMVPRGADELVEVVGKSMEPLIKDGEDVYIRHQPHVENGEIAIVRIEGDGVTCKRFYVDGDTVTLKSENPEYEDMHFVPSQVTVLGKVLL